MFNGLFSGILWGLDTIVLGIALSFLPFDGAVFLAPFVSTFLHDLFSSIWMLIYTGFRKGFGQFFKAAKTKSGRYVVLAALLAGPVGMTGYMFAIRFIGPSYTAIISALYPAVGALLAFLFLKEKMRWYQLLGLGVSIGGIILLGYSPNNGEVSHLLLGFLCALLCVLGWASEAVIISYGLRDPEMGNEQALLLRQTSSALCYMLIILPILGGWITTIKLMSQPSTLIVAAAGLFGTASYMNYYKGIGKIGPAKCMPLNTTYVAWAMLFDWIYSGNTPSIMQLFSAFIVVGGAILAATDLHQIREKAIA